MNAAELDNRGVIDLMSAMTALAYDDYVNGAILLKESEYEVRNGVVRLTYVRGRKFESYTSHQRTVMNAKVQYFSTAKMFLEGTRLGDYLLEYAEKDIADGKRKRTRKYTTLDRFEGVTK